MTSFFDLFNNFILIALPYVALFVFVIGTIWRYRSTKFKFSSLSSQFLEGRDLFWGSVPFHWGMLVLFLGHLSAFLIPRGVLAWNSHPVRLLVLEIAAFIFAIAVLVGLVRLVIRRLSNDRLLVVSNKMDFIIQAVLLIQVLTGLWIAYNFRWGSSWFATVLTPYLWSILTFQPDTAAVAVMPWPIRMHIAGAFVTVLLIPFSRLVHFLVVPINYLWRPYQQVIWNRSRKQIRNPNSPWSPTRPKNN